MNPKASWPATALPAVRVFLEVVVADGFRASYTTFV
jgi:hypothetical protein